MQSSCPPPALLHLTGISQIGVYTLWRPDFCSCCQATPARHLAPVASGPYTDRSHSTITNGGRVSDSYHPQGTTRGGRPRSSVFL